MDLKRLPQKIYWYGAVIIAAIAVFFYFFVGIEARTTVKDQLLAKQEVLNRAEASNISSFFESIGNSMTILARLDSIKSPDANTQSVMDDFVKQKADKVLGGIILTDTKGNVIYNSNIKSTHDTGMSIADRDYFSWAESQPSGGKYFVGVPITSRFGGSAGQSIVVVASPVFDGNTFKGLVGTSVELDALTQEYLNVLQVSDTTDVYLIDYTGTILYNNFNPGTVGSNIVGTAQEFKKVIGSTTEGAFSFSYSDSNHGSNIAHNVTYSPVSVGNQKWTLVMASPATDVWGIQVPMYIRIIIFLIFVAVSMFFFGHLTVREARKVLPQNSSDPESTREVGKKE